MAEEASLVPEPVSDPPDFLQVSGDKGMIRRIQAEPDWEAIRARLVGGSPMVELVRELAARPAFAGDSPKSLRRALFRIKAALPPAELLGGLWTEKANLVLV